MNNYFPAKISIIFFSYALYLLIFSVFNQFVVLLDKNMKISLHIQYYYFIDGEIIGYNGLPIYKVIDCYWMDDNNVCHTPHFVDIANTFIKPDTNSNILEKECSVKDIIVVIDCSFKLSKINDN